MHDDAFFFQNLIGFAILNIENNYVININLKSKLIVERNALNKCF